MKSYLFSMILMCFAPAMASAGGDRFMAEIVSLDPLPQKADEYRLVLRQFTQPYRGEKLDPPQLLTIRLRHNPKRFGWFPPPNISRNEYLQCIALLKQQFARGGRFKFAIMGAGYERIEGVDDEWQSNTLSRSPGPDFFVTSYEKLP